MNDGVGVDGGSPPVLSIGYRSGCPIGTGTAPGTRSASPPDGVAAAVAAAAAEQVHTGSSGWGATASCATERGSAFPSRDDDDGGGDFSAAAAAAVAAARVLVAARGTG